MNGVRKEKTDGASMIELLLVMAIIGIFVRLVTLDLFGSQQHTSLTAARDAFVRDIRLVQSMAMNGSTATPATLVDYSVRFEPTRYIYFPGSIYVNGDPHNTVVPLDSILQITNVTVSGSQITFARLSGDVRSYVSGKDSVTLTNTQTGQQYIIQLNARGVSFVQ